MARQYVGARLPTPLDDDFIAAAISNEPAREGPRPPDGALTSAQRLKSGAQSRRNLIEFLEGLPVSSVGQKHTAQFECDLDDTALGPNPNFQLVWLRLVRQATQSRPGAEPAPEPTDDISLLSLNKRVISPDKRFKVHHQPPSKWSLTIENVGPQDDKAFFLCQVSGGRSQADATKFVGGARLNVLAPPKIDERETSPSLVQADEFSALRLRCKVISEPQSQISWRREDGKSLDGLQQRFLHQIDRRPHQVLSIDSSELLFGAIRREQAGAYLCIASNGVQPGVSQRISVAVGKCREAAGQDAKSEPCSADELRPPEEPVEEEQLSTTAAATTTTSSTTRRPSQQSPTGWSSSRRWSGSGRVPSESPQEDLQTARRAQHQGAHRGAANQTDKSRGARYNQARRPVQTHQQQQRRPAEQDSSGARASFQYSISAFAAAAIVTALVGRSSIGARRA